MIHDSNFHKKPENEERFKIIEYIYELDLLESRHLVCVITPHIHKLKWCWRKSWYTYS